LPQRRPKLVDGFLGGEYDEVYVIYSKFVSMAKQLPVVQNCCRFRHRKGRGGRRMQTISHTRPNTSANRALEELLGDLLPRNVYVQIYSALLETSTSEHAARMTAMDNATKACNDMIDNLTLAYNKARQAAITADLMDIVGGAEALKGLIHNLGGGKWQRTLVK
jgi:F-type H+-transporting ATPase subunit gamma